MYIVDVVKSWFRPKVPKLTLGQLPDVRFSWDDGSKFAGGFGATEVLIPDYWTLRRRSAELYEKNLYARGLIRRLVTNEINVGLHLEATPEEAILGFAEDELADWTEETENRFSLWRSNAWLCDQGEKLTFGALQAIARTEALVAGDVLVLLRQDPRTQLPRVQLINGEAVQTPIEASPQGGNEIKHGVEVDSMGRQVAYWVRQPDGTSKRLPAFGEKSGRRLAWLLYGTDKRMDDVRGKPLLSLVLQSLKEIDRFRDSTQRKAFILSCLAMYIEKGEDAVSSRPLTRSATKNGVEVASSESSGPDRAFRTAQHVPGLVIEQLQKGEKPQAFQSNGTVETFGVFEAAIIQGIAWAHEMPPEILLLSFNSNYSASQAAINEFKMYLNKVRQEFGDNFCQPIYTEWLLAETLAGRVRADGFIEAWRDWSKFDIFAAWTSSDWTGQIKPSVDIMKMVKGYAEAVKEGFMTRDRAARETFGTKFSKNAPKLKRENELIAAANAPLAALEAATKAPKQPAADESKPQDDFAEGQDALDALEDIELARTRLRLERAA